MKNKDELPSEYDNKRIRRLAEMCTLKDDILYWNENETERVFTPNSLIDKILSEYHDDPMGGHLGIERTYKRIAQNFYWPSMKNDIKLWIKGCQICAEQKKATNQKKNTLHHTPRLGRAMSNIAIDIYGELPISKKGYKYILGIRCNSTRYTEFFPMKSITTSAVADILLNKIICRYGAIRSIHSDNGPQFVSKLIRVLCDLTNMKKTYTSTYYPEANASCERSFATLHLGLYSIAKRNKRDWCTYLPCVNAAINAAYSEAVGESPHKLVYGWDYESPIIISLGIPPTILPTEQEEYKEEFLNRIKTIRGIWYTIPTTIKNKLGQKSQTTHLQRR